MNRISFLNRGYAFKGLLAVLNLIQDIIKISYLILHYEGAGMRFAISSPIKLDRFFQTMKKLSMLRV